MGHSPAPLTVFFSYGFRPLFLLATLHAVMSVSFWSAWWLGLIPVNWQRLPASWHGHDMLMGLAAAAIGGTWSHRQATGKPSAAHGCNPVAQCLGCDQDCGDTHRPAKPDRIRCHYLDRRFPVFCPALCSHSDGPRSRCAKAGAAVMRSLIQINNETSAAAEITLPHPEGLTRMRIHSTVSTRDRMNPRNALLQAFTAWHRLSTVPHSPQHCSSAVRKPSS